MAWPVNNPTVKPIVSTMSYMCAHPVRTTACAHHSLAHSLGPWRVAAGAAQETRDARDTRRKTQETRDARRRRGTSTRSSPCSTSATPRCRSVLKTPICSRIINLAGTCGTQCNPRECRYQSLNRQNKTGFQPECVGSCIGNDWECSNSHHRCRSSPWCAHGWKQGRGFRRVAIMPTPF